MTAWLTVVGIGDDGYAGLGKPARRALADAAVVMGGERHLAMLPARHRAQRAPWPKPFDLAPLFARRPARVCVLASGDPMLFGVGALLARALAPNEWRVLPAPSSLSLAAALNVVAIECRACADAPRLALTPGLPDDAYRHDGQITKRDLRALALARLAPAPGELLWDVGAGCGSIGIEWMRAHPSCRTIAIEAHPDRQRFIEHNRDALGVPALELVAGRAPDALAGLRAPDAVFVGGGVSREGVLDACWAGLKPGGRFVAHAVTLQGEAALVAWRERHGGTLTRVSVAHAQPLGGFDAWRQALPVTLYDARKPRGAQPEHA